MLSFGISVTWEHQTAYDDGGVGSFAFVVLALFGLPWEFVGIDDFRGPFLSIGMLVIADFLIARRIGR